MKITIDIPQEFEKHFNEDRFKDSLKRIKADLNDEFVFAGLYERELLEMLIKAFKKAKLVKYGRWIKIDQYHFKCSECGAWEHVKFYPLDEHKFCWHCGAQMGGE